MGICLVPLYVELLGEEGSRSGPSSVWSPSDAVRSVLICLCLLFVCSVFAVALFKAIGQLALALPSQSSLYPAVTRGPQTGTKEKPPRDNLLIDLLTEKPPPYPEEGAPGEADPAPVALPLAAPAELAPSPVAGRLCGRIEPALDPTSQAFPLRPGPNGRLQYWPFSASDLYN